MKRRRMSAECEMDHSYAMPNVVSILRSKFSCARKITYLFPSLERQLKHTSEKDPKRVFQQTIKRYHPCSRRDIVSRASINAVYIQRRV